MYILSSRSICCVPWYISFNMQCHIFLLLLHIQGFSEMADCDIRCRLDLQKHVGWNKTQNNVVAFLFDFSLGCLCIIT